MTNEELEAFQEKIESFSDDLVELFNKHHMAILWKFDGSHLLLINDDAHVQYLARQMFDDEELVYPVCSTTDLDKLIKLDDGD